ncbi:fibronectin type III domain-containing protein, partial [Thermodesulfobacteriota bacterium]
SLSGSIPPELGNLTNLRRLHLDSNQLSGTIPTELGNLTNLWVLLLDSNQLSGTIPPEIGSLTNLEILGLGNNQLTGNIPTSLVNLSNLVPDVLGFWFTDISYNALYTDDDALSTFLDSKDPDWADTQTTAPEGVSAEPVNDTVIRVSWTPVDYTADPGVYLVFYSITPGGPYTLYGTTADKTVSQMVVTDLSQNKKYYFVVQTRTDSPNTIYSEYSEEVSVRTKRFPWELFIPAIINKNK